MAAATGQTIDLRSEISVVIITHNRLATLLRTVRLLRNAASDVPIVVVDNGSSDGTAAVLEAEFPDMSVIALQKNVGAHARTIGAAAANTPYVAFCDDDCWWHAGSLARAKKILDGHPRVAVLCARVLVEPGERLDPVSEEMSFGGLPLRNGVPGTAICGFLAGASVVRRDAFLAAGGFERRFFIGAEEALLSVDLLAAGWSLVYCPELVVHHHPSPVSRDPAARRHLELRNRLWTSWLRHSLPRAAASTMRLALRARRDRLARAALLDALCDSGWVLRRRRPVCRTLQGIVSRLVR